MSQERRRRSRLPSAKLEAKVLVKKSLFGSTWIDVRAFDFNKLGVGVTTTHNFNPEDEIVISFTLSLDMGSVALEEIPGVVKRASSVGGLNTYGVEFNQNSKALSKKGTQGELERIEDLLKKHDEIINRIKK